MSTPFVVAVSKVCKNFVLFNCFIVAQVASWLKKALKPMAGLDKPEIIKFVSTK